MKKIIGVLCCVVAAMACSNVRADLVPGEVIALDFGATAPTVANWNQLSTSTTSIADAQRLSDGNFTGVGVDFAISGVTFDGEGGANPTPTVFDNLSTNNSIDVDWSGGIDAGGTPNVAGNNVVTVTLTGLDDNLTYIIAGGHTRATGSTANFEYGVTSSSGDSQTDIRGYFEFDSVASSGGEITLTFTDEVRNLAISQLTIEAVPAAVPEPSSLALLGIGVVGLLARRRR